MSVKCKKSETGVTKYYVYCTANKINDKLYVGVHACQHEMNPDKCDYVGSGTVLENAFKKHGKENFFIDNIMEFSTKQAALDMEAMIVDQEFIDSGLYYNVTPGGGYPPHTYTEERRKNHSNGLKKAYSEGRRCPLVLNEESKKKLSESLKGRDVWNKGIPMTEETKQKLSIKTKEQMTPEARKYLSEKAKQQMTPEARKYLSDINTGKKQSDETKKKRSESLKKAHAEGRHSGETKEARDLRNAKCRELASLHNITFNEAQTMLKNMKKEVKNG